MPVRGEMVGVVGIMSKTRGLWCGSVACVSLVVLLFIGAECAIII